MAVRTRPADTTFPWDQRCLLAKRRRLLADATPTLPPGVAHPLTLSSRHAAVNLAIDLGAGYDVITRTGDLLQRATGDPGFVALLRHVVPPGPLAAPPAAALGLLVRHIARYEPALVAAIQGMVSSVALPLWYRGLTVDLPPWLMLGLGVAFRVAVKYEPDTDTQFESVSSVLRRDPRMPQLAAPVVLALEQKLLAAIGNYVGITVADLAQAVVQRRRGGDPELIQKAYHEWLQDPRVLFTPFATELARTLDTTRELALQFEDTG